MTVKHKRTLVLAGVIGTLFSCYEDHEKTRLHKQLQQRINTGASKMAKQYGVKEVDQIIGVDTAALWSEAVDHFKEKKIAIEASACVLSIWNRDEKMLAKHFGMSAAKIGKWAKPTRRSDAAELDNASREVAKYVFAQVNKLYGIEVEKKISLMEKIDMARKSA